MLRYVSGKDFGTVLCNGEELKYVVEVDTDIGFAIVQVMNEDGSLAFHIDEDGNPRIEHIVVTGDMTFIPATIESNDA